MELLGSRMMRKYHVRFRGGITEKELLLPRRYPTRHLGWPQAGAGPEDRQPDAAGRTRNKGQSVCGQHHADLAGWRS